MSEIVAKLQLTKFQKRLLLDCPQYQQDYFTELPFDTQPKQEQYDLIFAFVFDLATLKAEILHVEQQHLLAAGGYLFLAYPKLGNKNYLTAIHRDDIFPYLEVDDADGIVKGTQLKFSRMVKLDQDFTVIGLKPLPPQIKKTTSTSMHVADYRALIPEIQALLADSPELTAFFTNLTLGYQTDWAHFVFSAKQITTQAKRTQEMRVALSKGFKTKLQYQQFLKQEAQPEK